MPGALLEPPQERAERRLILCFDGTGNDYQALPRDTNVVKLLGMFDRSNANQMHYYQPGIGTYTADSSVNQSYLGAMKSNITKTIDTGLGTTFDHHVMAGYRFLMRYHELGDRIYIFGFSRGAFTARFLARMIAHVGLLSMGNEEMVPFAFKLYQDYEMDSDKWTAYMVGFRNTFCRHNPDITEGEEGGFKAHFLGLFDTVSSVGTLEKGTVKPPVVSGTSRYVRHAVAIDERRVKFKAALLAQDKPTKKENWKEVWFPGNHGDVGGGWDPDDEPKERKGFFGRLWGDFWKKKETEKDRLERVRTNPDKDKFQLSDIALKWMIDEVLATEKHWEEQCLDEQRKTKKPERRPERLSWNGSLDSFRDRYSKNWESAVIAKMHDTMAFGGGSTFAKVLLWNFMEYLPGIWRYEYYRSKKDYYWWQKPALWFSTSKPEDSWQNWQKTYFPLNMGGCRDLVAGKTLVHHSLIECMKREVYSPKNVVFRGDKADKHSKDSATGNHLLSSAQLTSIEGSTAALASNSGTPLYFKKQPGLKVGSKAEDMIYSVELVD